MSCSATTYSACPNPATTYFNGTLPSFTILSECCNESGVYQIIINGTNKSGDELWIDGTKRGCGDASLSSPCFTDDLSGSLVVTGYTNGAVVPSGSFQITAEFRYPDCGSCIENAITSLRFFASGDDTQNTELCCYVDIPVTINITDNAPFTLSTGALSTSVVVGLCDTQTFTITNDSCVQRKYSIALYGCTPGFTLSDTEVTLNSGATSSSTETSG